MIKKKINKQSVKSILDSIGWPSEILLLDFESYFDSDYSLGKSKKSLSIVEYVTDKRFEFTGLGFQVFNHELADLGPKFMVAHDVQWAIRRLQRYFGKAFHNCTVVAANCKFDMLILTEKFGIYPPYTIDVQDLSRYYDSRMSQKLKDLAKVFNLKPKGDTMQFKGLHYRDMTEKQRVAFTKYGLRDIEDEKDLLNILLPMIDNPKFELNLARHTLNLYLKPKIDLNFALAEEIGHGMDDALQADLDTVPWVMDYKTKIKINIPSILRAKKLFPKILADVLPDGEVVPMKQGKKEMMPATAKNDLAFQLLLCHKDEKVRLLCRAKAACSSWPLHRNRIRRLIAQAGCSNGKVRIPLKYYGAHTGRWSGEEKINPQNLGGKGRAGKGTHPLIGKVRNCFVAPDGYVFVITDSSQIEARKLAWLAGQQDLINGFAAGEDIYSVFATRLFGHQVWNPTDEEKKTPQGLQADIERGFGKDAILGCGFGMGTNKFFQRCRENDSLRPLFDSGKYDWDFINRLIKTYRTMYTKIPAYWTATEKAFRWVVKYSHETVKVGDLIFSRHGNTVWIQLPSGRNLFYRHSAIDTKGKLRYHHNELWGGTLVENIVQASSRDLLGYWLLECERNDISIVHHSHDELVGCVLEEIAEQKLKEMINIFSTGPEWANNFPLAAKGFISKVYTK